MEPAPSGTGSSGTGPSGTPLSPDFAGIDPGQMLEFVSELERGRDVIGEQAERIRQLLAAAQVPASGLQPVREIAGWIDGELPGLRRRQEMARATNALPTWGIGSPLVAFDESAYRSPEESRRQGTELGERFRKLGPAGFWTHHADSDQYAGVLKELEAGKHDAEFTAAFFAALGTAAALKLPLTFRENLHRRGNPATLGPPDPDDAMLRTLSQAFGSAVTAGAHVPGFAKIADAVRRADLSGEERAGADLLLSAGEFPPEWLAGVAAAWGMANPRKVPTGLMYALGNNPAAARLAIEKAAGPFTKDQKKLKEYLKEFNQHVLNSGWDSRGDAFGRMLAAAAGAYDEQDGAHSREAAAFAFTVMTTFGDFKVAESARVHLSELAGAYATEITEGANIGDGNMTEPSALKPTTSALGLKSAFTLSPQDTYTFMKLFADTDENLAPFEEAMGRFSQKLIADAVADVKRSGDTEQLDRVLNALGNVRGFEVAAAEKVRGELDALDEQAKKLQGFALDLGLGVGGLLIEGVPGQLAWFALSTGFSGKDAFWPESEKRTDKLDKADGNATLGRQHVFAQMLMANGFTPKVTPAEYQATCPPGVAIADAEGNLRPFPELLKQGNKGLVAFEKWADANGMGGDDELAFGRLSNDMASWFEGGSGRGRERAPIFDS
ncbi:DUF6571 family protein [Planomonospora venezuelensis]|uniref:DUF6571 domain-containing protein n=1 Tax=Planomonospora venezuelensis TaxID=1999 RepID=A0A841D4B0_PLAVE|nr:DUF6571 family protein [Planomonospora venezuelensis]MBB5963237.1 hypothetical protein [Planomonospora venezuelensis]